MTHTVLIVDDSPTEVSVVRKMLEDVGYRVLWAENAIAGIQTAMQEQPDLILMDVVMPGMSGFQATRKLKKTPETQKIPILMLTTKDQRSDEAWGLKMGAQRYMVKPPDRNRLLQEIRELIGG